jgi:hypothetical protein
MPKFAIIFPVLYAVAAALLLNLTVNQWFALQAFYIISWPASFVFASQPLLFESGMGVLQWVAIGLLADKFFRSKPRP